MSTMDIEGADPAFLLLFRHAGRSAAAQVAEALGPGGRAAILRQRRCAPPEGFCDWVAGHGDGAEVAALLERRGLTRAQAALAAARGDLGPELAAAVGTGHAAVPAGDDEAQWLASPAGTFRNAHGWSVPPSPELTRHLRARLGGDERAWLRVFELLAAGFSGNLPALLDAALDEDSPEAVPGAAPGTVPGAVPGALVHPKNEVAWLIPLAPGDLPRRLLARIAPWSLQRLAHGARDAGLVEALIDTGDREVWAHLFGGTYRLASRTGEREAEVERAFLRRDDPRINEWLLTGLLGPGRDRGYRLEPAVRLALLEGRPFGPGSPDPLPRTPAVHAAIEAPPSPPWDADLLRLCFDSREPGLAAQALQASLQEPAGGGEELLTPYQQLVAGIRTGESPDGTARLRSLLAGQETRVRDAEVRAAFTRAVAEDSVRPLREAAEARRERGGLLDEALRVWSLRLPAGLRPYRLGLFTQTELAATSRAVTGAGSYPVDWDLVRDRLADPDVRDHRGSARERYGILLAHADCPPDVAAALTAPTPGGLDLLRLYSGRDSAVTALTRGNLGAGLRGCWAGPAMALATPRPGWEPAVTPADVLAHARPAQDLLAPAPSDAVAALVEGAFGAAESADGPASGAGPWLALLRLTRFFSGPLPQLLRTAVRLAEGGTPLDTVPAADFLVGPDLDPAAGLVRERLGSDPGPWVRAVRLLAADFEGTLPELLDAASAEPAAQARPGAARLRCAPAALLDLAPRALLDAVVGALDPATRVVLARTTLSPDLVRSLVGQGDRPLWDALLGAPHVGRPAEAPDSATPRDLRDEVVVPALLALDDPWVNARLVREAFAGTDAEGAARTSAVLAGRPFGPREQPVPVLPRLRADFADWHPGCAARPPEWTRNPHFWTSPEPVLAMQAMMYVRQGNHQDPPATVLSVRQSLLAASTIAGAGRFDLLEHVVAHWHVRYPYGECSAIRELFERAVRQRSAAEIDRELSAPG
ncbi:hypothetical protein [Streptomyces sp. NPDC058157]|uniref:hypothetical protein n=1 Tax=Streptomyces sp. NPDC058157 TaxID=3346360 RepID=UPI0036EE219A